jgi:anti-sigma B factor antagonist
MPVVIKNKNRYNINLQGYKPEWMSADIRFMTSGLTVKCEGEQTAYPVRLKSADQEEIIMLNINTTANGDKLTVVLEGRLDTTTAPELDETLKNSITGVKELVFDFEGLEYMSSAGLRILLATQKKMSAKGGMKVTNVNDVISEIFEITGFSDILTIE